MIGKRALLRGAMGAAAFAAQNQTRGQGHQPVPQTSVPPDRYPSPNYPATQPAQDPDWALRHEWERRISNAKQLHFERLQREQERVYRILCVSPAWKDYQIRQLWKQRNFLDEETTKLISKLFDSKLDWDAVKTLALDLLGIE